MSSRSHSTQQAVGHLIAAATVGLVLVGCTPKADKPVAPKQPEPKAEKSSASPAKSSYKDGTYTAAGDYDSPAGLDKMDVTITLKAGVIEDASIDGKATHQISVDLQKKFSEGFKEYVVGKPIDTLDVDVVNGASLTTKGFMDAVEKIKVQAQA